MKILFQIKTIDVAVVINGKPKVLQGGVIYDVIGFEQDKFYITNVDYKPNTPQLIPWDMAKRIDK